ncbi:MAG: glutamate-5-semialdehyde dehydrogenase [Micavibrio sp.]|nr:glutamate-5-semialdehyde dehydrogenase [Micavibrio sp.]
MSAERNLTSLSPEDLVSALGRAAKSASRKLSQTTEEQINALLHCVAVKIRENKDYIISENEKDTKAGEEKGLTAALLDRLTLTPARIDGMADGVEAIAALPDPVGRSLWDTTRPNGLKISRVSAPIGVLGMIYESRPNVTVDAAALCLKSRNAVILRGGSESLHSSLALHQLIGEALEEHNLPPAAVSMIPVPDRDVVGAMLVANQYIDVMIPRGGKGLTGRVMNEARMPVFSHLDGICHIYVHDDVDPSTALEVTLNAKMRRTGICGAMETLLLDRKLDEELAKNIVANLIDAGCAMVGDESAQKLDSRITPATDDDWVTEYLDAKLSVRYVDGLEAAIAHINDHGSHHTESILTRDESAADTFQKNVDSGVVMHNTSTQFSDGGEFGMGAEIGIATGKMHARGPVGLEQLCTYKYYVHGDGQTRPK